MNKSIIDMINHYYTQKIKTFGASSLGVDWNSEFSQRLRFEQLARMLPSSSFTLNDLGCGYGALLDYLLILKKDFIYKGYDLSEAMISTAIERTTTSNAEFILSSECLYKLDYSISSGIFNVKADINQDQWQDHVINTLHHMHKMSDKGFAFNVLTTYSDEEYRKDNLFYADPLFLFDYCKRNFSKNVALLHDYNLYEFTIIVKHSTDQ